MSISFSRLRSFVAVAEERQFQRAAERLSVSQPSLSGQIRDLEAVLGAVLFVRTTRKVQLTAEGERFFHRARQILADVEAAVSDLRDRSDLKHGRIVVAATPSIACSLAPAAMGAFQARFPEITVQLHELTAPEIEEMLRNGLADIGFGPLPSGPSDLAATPLFVERFRGVVAAGHPLAGQSNVTLTRFLEHPLIATDHGTGIREAIDRALRDCGLRAGTGHHLHRYETIVALVEAGMGVALLPELSLFTSDLRRVSVLDVVEPEITREIGILRRKGGCASSAASEFFAHCTSEAVLAPFHERWGLGPKRGRTAKPTTRKAKA
ncbi:LysR family carnitine catabolism transcriptional activator [Azospirillum agricola]|uniref:LysR family transcriptional regulator n=1 Tax=Azospirillum agricola TaxID=1720247 RepID=UPI001AE2F1E9|nr:LysR family transcriptional regulator [Azospirillum agricola]MBP2231924.1 LysR family carnitine catabolism transcriptional activator [Azospirillum agricola]